jgi:hypothetical protein
MVEHEMTPVTTIGMARAGAQSSSQASYPGSRQGFIGAKYGRGPQAAMVAVSRLSRSGFPADYYQYSS